MAAENLAPNRIWCPWHPACSSLLYQLHYPSSQFHNEHILYLCSKILIFSSFSYYFVITFITHVSWDWRCFHHQFFLTHLCRVGGHIYGVPTEISEIESWENSIAFVLLVSQNPFLVHSALNLQLADLCFCPILLWGVFDKQSRKPWLTSLIMSVCLSGWLAVHRERFNAYQPAFHEIIYWGFLLTFFSAFWFWLKSAKSNWHCTWRPVNFVGLFWLLRLPLLLWLLLVTIVCMVILVHLITTYTIYTNEMHIF